MLEQLTEQQIALMPIIVNKWINKSNNPAKFDIQKAIDSVEWLYEASGLEKPAVLICKSPLDCQLAMISLSDATGKSMWDYVGDYIGSYVEDTIKEHIKSSVKSSVKGSVRATVWNSVWGIIENNFNDYLANFVKRSVWVSVKDKYFASCNYGDISDYNWTAFYDFFREIDCLEKNNDFERWLEYCEANIYYSIQYSTHCAVCPMPNYIKRDEQNRVHCQDGKAVEWSDGYGIYALNGIAFDCLTQEDLYRKIIKKELTLPEILIIENEEQREIALTYCNISE
jgi:hypothetical protein